MFSINDAVSTLLPSAQLSGSGTAANISSAEYPANLNLAFKVSPSAPLSCARVVALSCWLNSGMILSKVMLCSKPLRS